MGSTAISGVSPWRLLLAVRSCAARLPFQACQAARSVAGLSPRCGLFGRGGALAVVMPLVPPALQRVPPPTPLAAELPDGMGARLQLWQQAFNSFQQTVCKLHIFQ